MLKWLNNIREKVMEQAFYAASIYFIGAGAFCIVFAGFWIFGGKSVREQIKQEW